ncbi:MAG: 4-hydroxythreonine-4-phosphate dehydrogenase PdxA [Methylococcaceae bacterium]|nr:4-hydroxythreonine-4-phosphate dehydrogenase PdxA [Methylococcaceae bacterium]
MAAPHPRRSLRGNPPRQGMSRSRLPRILLTSGEPAGIGPDLCVLAAQRPHSCDLTVLADPELLADRADRLGQGLRIERVSADEPPRPQQSGVLRVWSVHGAAASRCGVLDTATAPYVLELLRRGTEACLSGRYDALVTAPVHKGIINDAGIPFTGHTEFLAEMTGGWPVMMLATPGLRVALATTHLPLAQVSAAVTRERLQRVLEVLDRELRLRFGIGSPRILVCGLNPHAGEGGHLGREELEVIGPVLEGLRAGGMDLQGPLPADTAFVPSQLEQADAVLAMYHDQGLPVLKHLGFGRAVNITLGLPIIRTSVDHGTALDRAGTGRIDSGSLDYALETAIHMAQASGREVAAA